MDNESLGKNFEGHFHGKKYGKDRANFLKSLVPVSQVVTVIIVVDSQDDRVEENQQNDEVLEQVRAGEVYELDTDGILVVQAIQGPVVVHKSLVLFG